MIGKDSLIRKNLLINELFWGLLLWLFGYILGFVFYAFVPKDLLGLVIMPFGVLLTLWILFKKIERKEIGAYLKIGLIWALIAIIFDYLFIVVLLKSSTYYKLDVYLYYLITFFLPITVGWHRLYYKKNNS